jgi:hypothetical protein
MRNLLRVLVVERPIPDGAHKSGKLDVTVLIKEPSLLRHRKISVEIIPHPSCNKGWRRLVLTAYAGHVHQQRRSQKTLHALLHPGNLAVYHRFEELVQL